MSAVIRDGAERFVLVEEVQTQAASTYQKQTIVFGQRMGNLIEVRGGNLFPGDRVVTRGSHELGSFARDDGGGHQLYRAAAATV